MLNLLLYRNSNRTVCFKKWQKDNQDQTNEKKIPRSKKMTKKI